MAISSAMKRFLTVLAVLLVGNSVMASDHSDVATHEQEESFNVNEMIMHHVMDAHEWHLWGDAHEGTSIYLPIILVDGGLQVFSSSHFYHGEHKTAIDEETGESQSYIVGVGPAEGYAMAHEEIYKLEHGELHFVGGHPHNAKPVDLSITRNVTSLFLTFILMVWIMFSVAKFYRKNGAVAPKGLAKFVEPIIIFVRDDIAKENIGEKKYKKYVPYLLTIFFFIWISNLTGLIPLLGSNLTGNISVTFFLAVCTLLVTVLSGNRNYWKHIFATPGVPVALLPIMIPIEVVGILTKPFALMVRLFANITAGHIIILALVSIIFINENAAWGALSVPMALFISVLELLVGVLQAYLFAMLSALFIGAAVEEAHH
ncbi:MAG: F0F1 ATP synthase subunit A [Crocinitomicaceae bacterium]|nr:F0F1 ATP synthase subunit A [Crocinitomicaceae bacterium]